jgi:hypothetical protein
MLTSRLRAIVENATAPHPVRALNILCAAGVRAAFLELMQLG